MKINSSLIRSSLLFFLSLSIGVILHCIIHELGHAIAIWIQGGRMTGFYFHPFNGGLNSSTYVENHLLLYAGGAFIGLPLTIIFMFMALRYRSPVMFPFIVTGSCGFLQTGIWMIKSVLNPEIATDYTYMIDLGSSELFMIIVGISFFLFGILSRIFFLPLAGIDSSVVLKNRLLIVFENGSAP